MGLVTNKINEKIHRKKEISYTNDCHTYTSELLADGFISPISLPALRIAELKGSESYADMSLRCKMPADELEQLINADYKEPTVSQLLNLSHAYNVSVFWLLGYHCDSSNKKHDAEIIQAIARRNSTEKEATLSRKGLAKEIAAFVFSKRQEKDKFLVAQTAARITVRQHFPISAQTLYALKGQPVFVEYYNGDKEWGLVSSDGIINSDGNILPIAEAGTQYEAYMTPYFI